MHFSKALFSSLFLGIALAHFGVAAYSSAPDVSELGWGDAEPSVISSRNIDADPWSYDGMETREYFELDGSDNSSDSLLSREESFHESEGHTVNLERRKGGIGDAAAEIGQSILTGILNGIQGDKDAREAFTKELVSKLRAERPGFNVVVCHVKHDYKWDGKQNVDWFHDHHEFDIKIGGTIGYEIYVAKSGSFKRHGDGGFLNWAFSGNVLTRDEDGSHLVFGKL